MSESNGGAYPKRVMANITVQVADAGKLAQLIDRLDSIEDEYEGAQVNYTLSKPMGGIPGVPGYPR